MARQLDRGDEMKGVLRTWVVKKVTRNDISEFIETHHYSGSINGCISDYCYALFDQCGDMKGAMFFGRMAMHNQYKRFSDKESEVIELRRLCCVDATPKNTESYFIGRALRLLKHDWNGKTIVSYADKEYGHVGTIYKASNFKMIGEVPGAKVIYHAGKKYHDKAIRTKYKGVLKPFALRLKNALKNGTAEYVKTKGKYTYTYTYTY